MTRERDTENQGPQPPWVYLVRCMAIVNFLQASGLSGYAGSCLGQAGSSLERQVGKLVDRFEKTPEELVIRIAQGINEAENYYSEKRS